MTEASAWLKGMWTDHTLGQWPSRVRHIPGGRNVNTAWQGPRGGPKAALISPRWSTMAIRLRGLDCGGVARESLCRKELL